MAKRAKKRANAKKTAARRPRQAPKMLSDLFLETLKDIYYAENKIIKTLPKMAKAAHSKDLAAAFNKHLRRDAGPGQTARPDLQDAGQAGRAESPAKRSTASPTRAPRS